MKTIGNLLMIFAMIAGINGMVSGQDGRASKADMKEQKEYEKFNRKEEKKRELERMSEITSQMVKLQRFVLEADYLGDKYGNMVSVSPSINFIMIDSLEGTVQFGNAFSIGYNGVGGETLDGKVTRYEYTMMGKKKDSYSIMMVFMSSLGTYDITFSVSPDGYADAVIRGSWSGQLKYHGKLVPLGLSKVYKGHTRY
jgi:hypothetical protein